MKQMKQEQESVILHLHSLKVLDTALEIHLRTDPLIIQNVKVSRPRLARNNCPIHFEVDFTFGEIKMYGLTILKPGNLSGSL